MKKVFVLFCLISISHSYAADCILHVKRYTCPGKEVDAYKKCDGKQECDEAPKFVETPIECARLAKDECSNARFTITKSKDVYAKFNGEPVMGNRNFCKANRPDFNKCK